MPLARADLESLLRTHQLDRTLTTALPPPDPDPEYACAPTGVSLLDTRLGGGFPRGQLSEIVGSRSAGRLSLLTTMLAAATRRGELAALIDVLDTFDVDSAAAAGVELDRMLWVRGHVVAHPGMCHDMNQRALEQAIRALTLVLQAGNFGLVAFDAGEAPPRALRRLPFTTWLRLQRMVEGRQTVCVLVASEPVARSSAGLTLQMGREGQERVAGGQALGRRSAQREGGPAQLEKKLGLHFTPRLFKGLELEARVVRARARGHEDVRVSVSTAAR